MELYYILIFAFYSTILFSSFFYFILRKLREYRNKVAIDGDTEIIYDSESNLEK